MYDLKFKEQKNQNTKGKKYSHTNTKKELDHIYVSQPTHTQSYQPVQMHRPKYSISNM
jgi:hypothetical protein